MSSGALSFVFFSPTHQHAINIQHERAMQEETISSQGETAVPAKNGIRSTEILQRMCEKSAESAEEEKGAEDKLSRLVSFLTAVFPAIQGKSQLEKGEDNLQTQRWRS